MANTIIKNYENISLISSKFDSSITHLQAAITSMQLSSTNIPPVMGSSLKESLRDIYETILIGLEKLIEECKYAIEGIKQNLESYFQYEEPVENKEEQATPLGPLPNPTPTLEETPGQTVEDISRKNCYYWGYKSGNERYSSLNERDFRSLEASGIGYYDEYGRFCIRTSDNVYRYDFEKNLLYTNNGKMNCTYHTSSSLENVSSTTTFLYGDGEKGRGEGEFESFKNVSDSNCNAGSMLIIPECPLEENFYDSRNSAMVTDCTEFGNLLIDSTGNSNIHNTIMGTSSGGISSFSIAAREGNDTYDTVVSVNGYCSIKGVSGGYAMTQEDALNLRNKEIIIMEATADNDNIYQRNLSSLDFFNNYQFENVNVVTSDLKLFNKANNYNMNAQLVSDARWKGHNSMYYMMDSSNIFSYVSSK